MPVDVRQALIRRKLLVAYRARPKTHQHDYLVWIIGAKRVETRSRRLAQMLDELKRGGLYLGKAWKPRKSATPVQKQARPRARR